ESFTHAQKASRKCPFSFKRLFCSPDEDELQLVLPKGEGDNVGCERWSGVLIADHAEIVLATTCYCTEYHNYQQNAIHLHASDALWGTRHSGFPHLLSLTH